MTTIRLPSASIADPPTIRPPERETPGAPERGAPREAQAGTWISPRRGRTARPFPKKILVGASLLLLFSIGAAIFGKTTDIGTIRNPVLTPLMIRDIVITPLPGDRLAVIDATTRETIETIEPNKDGFIRGAMNGLQRARMMRQLPADAPWRIIRWDNGRLTLSDTATGQRVELDAFGKTNAAAFARFLNDKGE